VAVAFFSPWAFFPFIFPRSNVLVARILCAGGASYLTACGLLRQRGARREAWDVPRWPWCWCVATPGSWGAARRRLVAAGALGDLAWPVLALDPERLMRSVGCTRCRASVSRRGTLTMSFIALEGGSTRHGSLWDQPLVLLGRGVIISYQSTRAVNFCWVWSCAATWASRDAAARHRILSVRRGDSSGSRDRVTVAGG